MKVALAFECMVVCLVVCHSCIMYSCHSLDVCVCVFCSVSFMLCYLQGGKLTDGKDESLQMSRQVRM